MERLELQLAKFAEKTNAKVETVIRKVSLELLKGVVLMSPVGNPDLWKHPVKGYVGGRFRGNWQVSIGVPAAGALDLTDRNGAATISKGAAVITNVRADESIWLVNNLAYARRIEYGWSKQAPAGCVRVTVARFQSLIEKTIRETTR